MIWSISYGIQYSCSSINELNASYSICRRCALTRRRVINAQYLLRRSPPCTCTRKTRTLLYSTSSLSAEYGIFASRPDATRVRRTRAARVRSAAVARLAGHRARALHTAGLRVGSVRQSGERRRRVARCDRHAHRAPAAAPAPPSRCGCEREVGRACAQGTDKNKEHHNFLHFYDEELSPIRESAAHVLEVGVRHGQSIAMWASRLPRARERRGRRARLTSVRACQVVRLLPVRPGPRLGPLREVSCRRAAGAGQGEDGACRPAQAGDAARCGRVGRRQVQHDHRRRLALRRLPVQHARRSVGQARARRRPARAVSPRTASAHPYRIPSQVGGTSSRTCTRACMGRAHLPMGTPSDGATRPSASPRCSSCCL